MTGVRAGSQGTGISAGSQGSGVAGGAGPAELTYKGMLIFEGSGPPASNLDFSSLSPEEGDLIVMSAHGAGGIENHFLPVDAGWASISDLPSAGHVIFKKLGPGETTGPASWVNVSADWHVVACLWSGGDVSDAGMTTSQTGGSPVLTGSSTTQRVLNDILVPVDAHLLYTATGTSSGAVYAGTPVYSSATLDSGHDSLFTTFGHAVAAAVTEGDGVATTDYSVTGLDTNFNFNSTAAFGGSYATVVPEGTPILPMFLGERSASIVSGTQAIPLAPNVTGDLLIVGTNNRNTGTFATAPVGWTRIATVGDNAALAMTVFAKISTGGETSVTLSGLSTGGALAWSQVWKYAGLPAEDGQLGALNSFNSATPQDNGILTFSGSSSVAVNTSWSNPANLGSDITMMLVGAANDFTTATPGGTYKKWAAYETTVSNDSSFFLMWNTAAATHNFAVASNGIGITVQACMITIPAL